MALNRAYPGPAWPAAMMASTGISVTKIPANKIETSDHRRPDKFVLLPRRRMGEQQGQRAEDEEQRIGQDVVEAPTDAEQVERAGQGPEAAQHHRERRAQQQQQIDAAVDAQLLDLGSVSPDFGMPPVDIAVDGVEHRQHRCRQRHRRHEQVHHRPEERHAPADSPGTAADCRAASARRRCCRPGR